jgi:3-dehydroquinate dehydratase
MNTDMQRRALAARDAHSVLLDLRNAVDEVAQTVHAAEIEAVHLAIRPSAAGDVSTTLRVAIQRLEPANFEHALSRVREKLLTALS